MVSRRHVLRLGGGILGLTTSGLAGYELGYRRAEDKVPEDSDGDMIPDAVEAFPSQQNEAAYVTQLDQMVEIPVGSYSNFDISTPEESNKTYILDYTINVVDGPPIDIFTLTSSDFERYRNKSSEITPLFGSDFGVDAGDYSSIKTGDMLILDNTELGGQGSEVPTGTAVVQLELKVYPQVHPMERASYNNPSSKYPSLTE